MGVLGSMFSTDLECLAIVKKDNGYCAFPCSLPLNFAVE